MSTDARATLPYSATVDEAARLSGLSKSTLYELMSAGKIEAKKLGRRTLIVMDGVRKHVDGLPPAKIQGRRRQ